MGGEMDCACAREVELLRDMGCKMLVNYNIDNQAYSQQYKKCMEGNWDKYFLGHLRCLHNGNFDPVQCIPKVTETSANPVDNLENCFCIDNDLNVNSSVVPINIADIPGILPCYNSEVHYPGFYRPCQIMHVNRRKTEEEYEMRGEAYIVTERLPTCTPDGYYDKVQVEKDDSSRGYCADRLGQRLEDYKGDVADMDCECALVRRYTEEGGDKPHCEDNGSYRNWQCRSGKCYCVDRYGRQCKIESSQLDFNPDECDRDQNSWYCSNH